MTLLNDEISLGIIRIYESKRDCRCCKNFIRVKEEGDYKRIRRRGFCIYGQLEGDFGLYISSSKANDCLAFVFDEYNYETTKKENELAKKWNEFNFKLEDRRTKEYREVSKFLKDLSEFLSLRCVFSKKNLENMTPRKILNQMGKVREMAYDYFLEQHREEIRQLRKRRALSYQSYCRVLSTISKTFEIVLKEEVEIQAR